MLAKVLSAAVLGIEAYQVEVEVDLSPGLAAFLTVGLPDAAAIKNTGHPFPLKRITVNLAPTRRKLPRKGYDGKEGIRR